jgi:small-conductance mechanosensitive channel
MTNIKMESKRVFNQYFKIQNLLTSFKLYFNLRGTFFKNRTKSKIEKKIFSIFIFLILFSNS